MSRIGLVTASATWLFLFDPVTLSVSLLLTVVAVPFKLAIDALPPSTNDVPVEYGFRAFAFFTGWLLIIMSNTHQALGSEYLFTEHFLGQHTKKYSTFSCISIGVFYVILGLGRHFVFDQISTFIKILTKPSSLPTAIKRPFGLMILIWIVTFAGIYLFRRFNIYITETIWEAVHIVSYISGGVILLFWSGLALIGLFQSTCNFVYESSDRRKMLSVGFPEAISCSEIRVRLSSFRLTKVQAQYLEALRTKRVALNGNIEALPRPLSEKPAIAEQWARLREQWYGLGG